MRKESRKNSAIHTGKELLKFPRIYSEAKQQIVEHAVTTAEGWNSRWIAIAFILGMVVFWVFTVWSEVGFEVLYEEASYCFTASLVFSYFFFFHVSRLVFRPTQDELSDDTSWLAVFSACRRREQRGFFSLGFAVLHTGVVIGYLIHQDIGWLNVAF